MEEDWTRIEQITDEEPLSYEKDQRPEQVPESAELLMAWADNVEERHIAIYAKDVRHWVVRSLRKYVGCEVTHTTDSREEARGIAHGLQTGWDGLYTDRELESDTPTASQAELCPYCSRRGTSETPDGPESPITTDEGNLLFHEKCTACGGRYATISVGDYPSETVHTLQFVAERDEEDQSIITGFKAIKLVPCDEDDPNTTAERAEFNMKFGECVEVQGADWCIEALYDGLSAVCDLPEETESSALRHLTELAEE